MFSLKLEVVSVAFFVLISRENRRQGADGQTDRQPLMRSLGKAA